MSMTSRNPRRKLILIGLTILMLVLLGYGFDAFFMLSKLNDATDRWIADRVAQGWAISHKEIKPKLYFDHVSLRIPNPAISANAVQWTGEYLSVSQYFLDPNHFKIVVNGINSIQWPDAKVAISVYPLRINFHVSRSDGSITDINATANDVQWVKDDSSAIFAQALGLSLSAINPAQGHTKPFANFIGTVAGLEYKTPSAAPASPISVVEVRGTIMGQPPMTLPQDSFNHWSADGGTLEVSQFVLQWPPVKVEGDGTVAFDTSLKPVAAFATHVQGLVQLADSLRQTSAVSESDAETLRSAAHSQNGSAIPITVQNGKIWMGSVAIADQPTLPWVK